eukprot:Rhum_TRINITY_DN10372_c0_g2::Rhum_TRINITY_DN10372_c0_g2_i1::g.38168::m.38168
MPSERSDACGSSVDVDAGAPVCVLRCTRRHVDEEQVCSLVGARHGRRGGCGAVRLLRLRAGSRFGVRAEVDAATQTGNGSRGGACGGATLDLFLAKRQCPQAARPRKGHLLQGRQSVARPRTGHHSREPHDAALTGRPVSGAAAVAAAPDDEHGPDQRALCQRAAACLAQRHHTAAGSRIRRRHADQRLCAAAAGERLDVDAARAPRRRHYHAKGVHAAQDLRCALPVALPAGRACPLLHPPARHGGVQACSKAAVVDAERQRDAARDRLYRLQHTAAQGVPARLLHIPGVGLPRRRGGGGHGRRGNEVQIL